MRSPQPGVSHHPTRCKVVMLFGPSRKTEGDQMGIIYKLEHPDGTPVDPPTFQSAAGTTWNVGDPLYLGSRTLRVVATRSDEGSDGDPCSVLIVKPI